MSSGGNLISLGVGMSVCVCVCVCRGAGTGPADPAVAGPIFLKRRVNLWVCRSLTMQNPTKLMDCPFGRTEVGKGRKKNTCGKKTYATTGK